MEDDDLMGGQDGADYLNGGEGVDVLFGEAGRDVLVGGGGADQVYGGAEDDLIGGQGGDDFLSGDDGRDTLLGEEGRDRLVGGSGDDQLAGGGEADVFVFGLGAGTDRVFDFEVSGGDRFDLGGRRFAALQVIDVDGDGRADSMLTHDGGAVVVYGVSDLGLADWNTLVV
jgi:Ca2+-binding RTX toxin-like protein